MPIVWIAFGITAIALGIGGWIALRSTSERAPVFRTVGKFLLALAGGTALFPGLLTFLGAPWWIGAYVAFVLALTARMTVSAVTKARQVA